MALYASHPLWDSLSIAITLTLIHQGLSRLKEGDAKRCYQSPHYFSSITSSYISPSCSFIVFTLKVVCASNVDSAAIGSRRVSLLIIFSICSARASMSPGFKGSMFLPSIAMSSYNIFSSRQSPQTSSASNPQVSLHLSSCECISHAKGDWYASEETAYAPPHKP